MMLKNNLKDDVNKKAGFPIPVSSYKMILIGFGIVVLGFVLMICNLDVVDQIITDAGVSPKVVKGLEDMGIKVSIV